MEAARRKGVLPNDVKTDTVASTDQPADADVRDMHRVVTGETLRSIAKQYGVSVDTLKNANGINSNSVRTGTMLVIPNS
jgi:N-acetylmuramoyl-L-alanine amidase